MVPIRPFIYIDDGYKSVLSLRTGVLTLSRSCVGAVHGDVSSMPRCAALRTVRARPALGLAILARLGDQDWING